MRIAPSFRLILPTLGLIACCVAGFALANQAPSAGSPNPDDGAARSTPLRTAPASTLMLTVQIDARGVTVVQSTRKPSLEWRAPRRLGDMNLRWTMFDARGEEIAEGGIDPGKLCLDPSHAGQPPHMEGDVAIPHVTHTNLKVPDLPAFDRIEFRITDAPGARAFGTVSRNTVEIR